MARKTERTNFGFTTENLNTAAANLIGSFDKDGSVVTQGAHFDLAQTAVETAYTTLAADPLKCGKSNIPTTTDVARLAYTNLRGLIPNFDELVEAELPGAGVLTDAKLAAFTWEWTGEGDDHKFSEIARLHVPFRHLAKAHIAAMKAQAKAAAAAERQAKKTAETQTTGQIAEVTEVEGSTETVKKGRNKKAEAEAESPVAAGEVAVS